MKYSVLILLSIALCSSCRNKEIENLKYEIKVKNQMISELSIQNTKLEHELHDIKIDSINGKKFVFAIFTFEKTNSDSYNKSKSEIFYRITEIKEFNNFNEEMKYRFMDNYMNDAMLKLKMEYLKENLKDRQCFAFNSYLEASSEREKYTTNKNFNN